MYFVMYLRMVVRLFLSLSFHVVLDPTNRTPLEISLRAFMGYPGLFQHTYMS